MVNLTQYKNAVEGFYTDRCDVLVKESSVDEKTGRNVQREKILLRDIPCRLSHDSVRTTGNTSRAAAVMQGITLFLSSAYDVPPGAIIDVTRQGRRGRFRRAGKSALYRIHQEIPLEIEGAWA